MLVACKHNLHSCYWLADGEPRSSWMCLPGHSRSNTCAKPLVVNQGRYTWRQKAVISENRATIVCKQWCELKVLEAEARIRRQRLDAKLSHKVAKSQEMQTDVEKRWATGALCVGKYEDKIMFFSTEANTAAVICCSSAALWEFWAEKQVKNFALKEFTPICVLLQPEWLNTA